MHASVRRRKYPELLPIREKHGRGNPVRTNCQIYAPQPLPFEAPRSPKYQLGCDFSRLSACDLPHDLPHHDLELELDLFRVLVGQSLLPQPLPTLLSSQKRHCFLCFRLRWLYLFSLFDLWPLAHLHPHSRSDRMNSFWPDNKTLKRFITFLASWLPMARDCFLFLLFFCHNAVGVVDEGYYCVGCATILEVRLALCANN